MEGCYCKETLEETVSLAEWPFYALPAPDLCLKERSLRLYFYRKLQLLGFLLMYNLLGFSETSGSTIFFFRRDARKGGK